MICVCIFMTGTPEGSTESGFMENSFKGDISKMMQGRATILVLDTLSHLPNINLVEYLKELNKSYGVNKVSL